MSFGFKGTVMEKGLVSIIVLNWNNKDVVFDCLESLLVQTHTFHEIILVDNGSIDGSLEMIEDKYASVIQVIKNGKNLGFAEGVNVGIRASKGEFIAIINSDAVAKENWIEELVNATTQSESIGMCACKIYFADHEGIIDNTGEVLCRDGLNRGRGRLEKDHGQYDSESDVLCPSGCAALYKKEMLNHIGLFDKCFFAYGEDLEIGLRGRLLDYGCVYVPSAIVYHKLSASLGVFSPIKAFYVERNRLLVLLKCFPLGHIMISPYYTMIRYFYYLRGIFVRRGPAAHYAERFSILRLCWILLKAYLSTIWHLPYLLVERSKLKKKSKWTRHQFEECLKSYEISPRDIALGEISLPTAK